MALQAGIVGLPNVGKSTLFNALTNAGAESANYPFCTIEPNTGIVPVPDPRLKVINNIIKTQKIIPAVVEVWTLLGLSKALLKVKDWAINFLETSELWMPFCMWFVVLNLKISTT